MRSDDAVPDWCPGELVDVALADLAGVLGVEIAGEVEDSVDCAGLAAREVADARVAAGAELAADAATAELLASVSAHVAAVTLGTPGSGADVDLARFADVVRVERPILILGAVDQAALRGAAVDVAGTARATTLPGAATGAVAAMLVAIAAEELGRFAPGGSAITDLAGIGRV